MPRALLRTARLGLAALVLAFAFPASGETIGDTFGQQFCGDGTFGWCNNDDKKSSSRPREVGPRSRQALRNYRGAVDEFGRAENGAGERVSQDAQNGVCQGAECSAAGQLLGSANNGIGQLNNLGTSLDQKANQARTELLRDLGRSGASRAELDAFARAFDRGRRPSDAEINSLAPRTQDFAHALRTINDEQKFIAQKAEDYGGAGNTIGGMQRKLAAVAGRGTTLAQSAGGSNTAGSARYPSGFKGGGGQTAENGASSLALAGDRAEPSSRTRRLPAAPAGAGEAYGRGNSGAGNAKQEPPFTLTPPPALAPFPEPGTGEVSSVQQDQRELDELSFMVSQLQGKRGHGVAADSAAGGRSLLSDAGEGGAPGGGLEAAKLAAELLADLSLFTRVTTKIRGRWKDL